MPSAHAFLPCILIAPEQPVLFGRGCMIGGDEAAIADDEPFAFEPLHAGDDLLKPSLDLIAILTPDEHAVGNFAADSHDEVDVGDGKAALRHPLQAMLGCLEVGHIALSDVDFAELKLLTFFEAFAPAPPYSTSRALLVAGALAKSLRRNP